MVLARKFSLDVLVLLFPKKIFTCHNWPAQLSGTVNWNIAGNKQNPGAGSLWGSDLCARTGVQPHPFLSSHVISLSLYSIGRLSCGCFSPLYLTPLQYSLVSVSFSQHPMTPTLGLCGFQIVL